MSQILKYKRLSPNAFKLIKHNDKDAGYDLSSAYNYIIPKHGKELIKTDIAIDLPMETYGRIASRSGLAWKNFIFVAGGVIDEGYRGNICVILYNLGNDDFVIQKGDRIAQLICEKITKTQLMETNTISFSDRDKKGFGSTGTNDNKNELY